MSSIAIVTARGGSKRIPRKNVKPFLGKPMIAYALEQLVGNPLFDRVVVTTDDDEIAEVAERCGAQVPFRRPAHLSDDHASTDAVLMHALQACQELFGPLREGCCVYPTNPFLTRAELAQGHALMQRYQAISAFPVVAYEAPIEHAFTLEDARPRPRWPEKLEARSQDLPRHYHDAGMFYWFRVTEYLRAGNLFNDNCVAFPVPAERCQDINTEEDWARAELKYRLLYPKM